MRGNWQDFNLHDASRGPSAIAELLVTIGSFDSSYFRKYATDLREIFRTVALWIYMIDVNGVAIAQGTLPWQLIFVYSIHTFFVTVTKV